MQIDPTIAIPPDASAIADEALSHVVSPAAISLALITFYASWQHQQDAVTAMAKALLAAQAVAANEWERSNERQPA